jgi:hypothetical protein
MPSEASLEADPRTAAQNTINEASDEVRKGIDVVVSRFNDMTGRGGSKTESEPPPTPTYEQPTTPTTPSAPPDSHDAPTTHLPPSP